MKMVEIGSVVTDEFVEGIIKNSENPLMISDLVKIIKTETKGVFIRRKIMECLGRMEKSGLFNLEEHMIDPDQYQYGKIIVLNSQELS